MEYINVEYINIEYINIEYINIRHINIILYIKIGLGILIDDVY